MPKRQTRKKNRQIKKNNKTNLVEKLEPRQLLTATAGDSLDFEISLTNDHSQSLYSTNQNFSYEAPWQWTIPNEGNATVQGSGQQTAWTAVQSGQTNAITHTSGMIKNVKDFYDALTNFEVREVSENLVGAFYATNDASPSTIYKPQIENAWIGSSDNLYSLLILNQRFRPIVDASLNSDGLIGQRGGNGFPNGGTGNSITPTIYTPPNPPGYEYFVSEEAIQGLSRIVGFSFTGFPVASAPSDFVPQFAVFNRAEGPFKPADLQPHDTTNPSLSPHVPTLRSFFSQTNKQRPITAQNSGLPIQVLNKLEDYYAEGFQNKRSPIEIFSEISGIANLEPLIAANAFPQYLAPGTMQPILPVSENGPPPPWDSYFNPPPLQDRLENYSIYEEACTKVGGYYLQSGISNQDAINSFFNNFANQRIVELAGLHPITQKTVYDAKINELVVGLRALMAMSYDAAPLWSSYGTGYSNAANPMVGSTNTGIPQTQTQTFLEGFSGQEFQIANIELPTRKYLNIRSTPDAGRRPYPNEGWYQLNSDIPLAGEQLLNTPNNDFKEQYSISTAGTRVYARPDSTSSDTLSAAGLSVATEQELLTRNSSITIDGTTKTLGDLPGLVHDEVVLPNPFGAYISLAGGVDVVTGSSLNDVIVGPGHGQQYDPDFHGRLTVSAGDGNDVVAPGRGGSVIELGSGGDHVVFDTNDLFGEATFYDFHYHEGDRIIVNSQIDWIWDHQTPETLILLGPHGETKTLRLAGSSDRVWHRHVVKKIQPTSSVTQTTASPAGEFNYLETHLFVLPPVALPADEVNVGELTLNIDPATISKTGTVPNTGSNSSRIAAIDTTGLRVGMTVSGLNIPTGATISAITPSSNAILLSTPIITGNGASNVTLDFIETLPPVMWIGLADVQYQIKKAGGGFSVKLGDAFPGVFEGLGLGSAYQISVTPYDAPSLNNRGFGSRQAEVFITRNHGYVQSDQNYTNTIKTSDLSSVPKTGWRILELSAASGTQPASYAIGYLGGLANFFLDYGMNSNGSNASTTGLQITVDNDFFPGVGQGAPSLSGRMATWGPFSLDEAKAIMSQTANAPTGAFAGELPANLQAALFNDPTKYIGIKHLTTDAPIVVNGIGRINGYNIISDQNYRNVSDAVQNNPIYQINSDMFTASSVYQTVNTDDSNWAIDISGITVAWPAYRGVGSVLVQDFNNAAIVVDTGTKVDGERIYGIDFDVSSNPFFEFRNSKVKVYDYKQVGGWVDRADGPGISAWHSEIKNSFIHTNDDSIKVQAPFYHALNNTILQGNAGSMVGYAYGFINTGVADSHVDFTYGHRVVNKAAGNGYGLAAMRIVPSMEWTKYENFVDTQITNLIVNANDLANVGSMNSVHQANVIEINNAVRGFGPTTVPNTPNYTFEVGAIETNDGWKIGPIHDLSPTPSQITVGNSEYLNPGADNFWHFNDESLNLLAQNQPTKIPANTTAIVRQFAGSKSPQIHLYQSPIAVAAAERIQRPKLHRSSKIYLNRDGVIGPSPIRLVHTDLVQAAAYGATAGEESFIVSNVVNGRVEKKIGDSWFNVSEAITTSRPSELIALMSRRVISSTDEIRWVPSTEDSTKATAEAFAIFGWNKQDGLVSDRASVISFEHA